MAYDVLAFFHRAGFTYCCIYAANLMRVQGSRSKEKMATVYTSIDSRFGFRLGWQTFLQPSLRRTLPHEWVESVVYQGGARWTFFLRFAVDLSTLGIDYVRVEPPKIIKNDLLKVMYLCKVERCFGIPPVTKQDLQIIVVTSRLSGVVHHGEAKTLWCH